MSNEYIIRRFTYRDSVDCHAIRRSAFYSDFVAELPAIELRTGADAFSPEVFGELLLGMVSYVATRRGVVDGFCSICTIARGEAEVLYLYLKPEARGIGLGAVLLAHVEDATMRENPDIRLFSVQTGVPAYNRRFWERQGYTSVGNSFCRFPDGTLQSLRLEKLVAVPASASS